MPKNRFLNNASWLMVSRAIQLALTFICTMLVSRYLGPDEYGKLTYTFSYIQFFLPLCVLGMNDIAVKELVDNKDENDQIVGTMIILRLIVSVISMVLSVSIVNLLNNNPIYYHIAFLQSFVLLFQSFDSIIYYFQTNLLGKNVGIVLSITYFLTTIFRLFAIYLKKDIMWFAFAMSLDYFILAILLLLIYYRKNKLHFSFLRAKQLLKKSYYYVVAGLLVVLYGKVTDTILLGRMVNDEAVGYYGAATSLSNAWPFVLTAIIDSASPLIFDLFNKDKEMFNKKLKQLYLAIFYISVVVAIMIGVLGKIIILILYGDAYLPAVNILRIVAWSTGFSYLGVARIIWMQSHDKTRYEIIISLFGAITNIILNYFLIKRFNVIGAAIANTLTQFLTNFIFLFVMKDTRENAKLMLEAILLKGIK